MSSKFAVVTVTYSPGDHLEACLASLERATKADPLVVMVDNGSTDGAPQRAAALRPKTVLVETGENIGFGRGVNRGVAEIDALAPEVEFYLVVNPDVVFAEGSVDALLEAAGRWPDAGALGPLIEEPDGSAYPSARAVPTLALGSAHALLVRIWPDNPWTRRYLGRGEGPGERVVGWLSGACLLLRREAFSQVGGFDEGYFMYFEDVDLGDRLGKAGLANVYVPGARVSHAQGHSTKRHPARMLQAHHDSAYRFFAERHKAPWQAPLRLAVRVGLNARAKAEIARKARAAE
jgi:N-acetylglucosaminyl-diphospho-decaprenol L-rhamnosyltransferase